MAKGRLPPGPPEGADLERLLLAGGEIGDRLRLVSLLTRRIEQRLGEHLGVNLTDLSAMEHLISNGPLTPSDLASRLEVTTAASTHIVDRLERAGHVSRERDATDRRKVLVVPVEASVARVIQQLTPMLESLDAVVAGLSEADRAVVERFLGQIIDVYVTALERPAGT
ncbi:Transcriptional regulator, MarR family [Cystobacter fuscus]|uniref:Transcriptional regulator, MarR family n=1 Tax=Cystobacter fuscus TaxID=43 RepID=A0A250J5B4_9BACT|nr:MarR family transcriptional regulator [Cystobacter fuscus]ATB38697.1 Transcriptional regulator, MarR family [Cystobacter fuscus]